MRRADRLFQIVDVLRRRKLVTAGVLARRFGVSERTIYRDIQVIVDSGVLVEGEAGVGYMLRGYDLPPLMFSRTEVEALVLGARIVQSWGDDGLAESAASALSKIESVLPDGLRDVVEETRLFAPDDHFREPPRINMESLRTAIHEGRKIRFDYVDGKSATTSRVVHPLGLAFYGPVWLLASWCELRSDFRAFRPDRMESLVVLSEKIPDDPSRSMDAFLSSVVAASDEISES